MHTWISIGNWILNLICFLHFFYLSTPFAVLLRFYFLPFLHGKNAQNRPKNQQNWNLWSENSHFCQKCPSLLIFGPIPGHYSLVKSEKIKIAFLQQKECSNQKIEENKSGLEFDFLWKFKCASLYSDFLFLNEPYWTIIMITITIIIMNIEYIWLTSLDAVQINWFPLL